MNPATCFYVLYGGTIIVLSALHTYPDAGRQPNAFMVSLVRIDMGCSRLFNNSVA